jgi:hypothetical protein
MTRSEEQVRAGTETVTSGKAGLRNWVDTEQQNVSVPVRKEKARLETEPITDANPGWALDGPAISEEEHVVTLTEQRPVVAKESGRAGQAHQGHRAARRAALRRGPQGADRGGRRRRPHQGHAQQAVGALH